MPLREQRSMEFLRLGSKPLFPRGTGATPPTPARISSSLCAQLDLILLHPFTPPIEEPQPVPVLFKHWIRLLFPISQSPAGDMVDDTWKLDPQQSRHAVLVRRGNDASKVLNKGLNAHGSEEPTMSQDATRWKYGPASIKVCA